MFPGDSVPVGENERLSFWWRWRHNHADVPHATELCFAWLRWQILRVFFESYKKSNEGDKDPPVRARHTDVPGGPTRVNCLPSLPAGTRPQDTVRTTEATWASTSSHSPPQSRGRTYKRRRGQSYRMTTPDMQGFHALPTGLCAIYEGTMRPGQEEA